MNIGKTVIIHLLSKTSAKIVLFIATIYLARVSGASTWGMYSLVLALLSWFKIAGFSGVGQATVKRLSEGQDRNQYFVAGAISMGITFLLTSSFILFFRPNIDSYVGSTIAYILILLLFFDLLKGFVDSALKGSHLVHIYSILEPIKVLSRSFVQVSLVVLGLGLTGLLLGYATGAMLVSIIGFIVLSPSISQPNVYHFKRLFDYAKYAWAGSVKSRSFSSMDILILGFFVSASSVGIYSIAWSIAAVLSILGNSIRDTFFPEISRDSIEDNINKVEKHAEITIKYAGIIIIPGLVGGLLIGERILLLYSEEFTEGVSILSILVGAMVFKSYYQQLNNLINAVDRPDITFKINLVFIISNLIFNIILIQVLGSLGAAIATASSTALALILSYYMIQKLINLQIPHVMIGKQWLSTIPMALVIVLIDNIAGPATDTLFSHILTIVIVLTGASTYFLILMYIETDFKNLIDSVVNHK